MAMSEMREWAGRGEGVLFNLTSTKQTTAVDGQGRSKPGAKDRLNHAPWPQPAGKQEKRA